MPSAEYKPVTEARRALVLDVLEQQTTAITFKVLLSLLSALHLAGRWPQASWMHARNDPYDVGLRQHLEALARQGKVEVVLEAGYWPRWKSTRGPMRKHAAEALKLKEEEKLTGKQIATRLGISNSLAYSLLNDPYGEQEKRRKAGYCPGCGTKKDPDAAVCDGCIARKNKKDQQDRELLLPAEDEATRIVDTFAAELRAGREAVLGVTEDFRRVIRWRTRRGEVEHVLRRDESWSDGMVSIGLWS